MGQWERGNKNYFIFGLNIMKIWNETKNMIIFYYYKEDTCKLNWNNIVFSSSTIDDYMSILIQWFKSTWVE